ncbi:MAG: hypothetical protein J6N72_04930 [Psychrobacter sp.]|nr:hypothetical protein [Psychrobacter sp.]
MGQAKQRGNKDERIKQAVERGDTKYASEVERHMANHETSKPIVDKVFKNMMDLLEQTNVAKNYGINSIEQLHRTFYSGNNNEITVLFWYFLYKDLGNREFNSVDYCHGCKKYALHKNKTINCGLGFTKSKIEGFYETVEKRLASIDNSSKEYVIAILECVHNMSIDDSNYQSE